VDRTGATGFARLPPQRVLYSARGTPCRWRRAASTFVCRNLSGRILPTCEPGSAQGLRKLTMHNGQRVDRFKALVQPAPVKLPSVLGVTLVLGTSPVVGDSGRCGTLQARCVAAAGDDPLSLRTRCWRSPNLAPITAARRRRRRDGHRNGGG